MQVQSVVSLEGERSEPVRAWIESFDGAIVRGVVDVLSEDGAVIHVAANGNPPAPGDEVTVRLSFARTAPTQAAPARVLSVRGREDAAECEVEWMPGAERSRLASLVATLG